MKVFRAFVWGIVIVGWLVAILWALIEDRIGLSVAFGILAVTTWISLGFFFGWIFGIKRHVQSHLGSRVSKGTELVHRPHPRDCQDIQRALKTLLTENYKESQCYGSHQSYMGLLDSIKANFETQSLKWESYEIAPSQWEELPSNALYLMRVDEQPFVVGLWASIARENYDDEREFVTNAGPLTLYIVGVDHKTLQTARDLILDKARAVSALKAKTIIVRANRNGKPEVEFTKVDPVDRAKIVLPDEIFAAVDRTIIQQMDAADSLRKAGQRTRTAILLFGPPGTGKTLLTRYLISQTEGYTTLLIRGFQREVIRESFRLARYLEPALLVLEDVDLIAVRRQKNRGGTTALHALLDELDGLVPEARCGVIMTTNRPDVLEPALASRPGRVTQAIEFPMPTLEQRDKLLTLFLSKTDAQAVDTTDWATRTEGASPAFLEELVRRAVLISIGRTNTNSTPVIQDQDFREGMHEIVSLGGLLTKQLLGYAESR